MAIRTFFPLLLLLLLLVPLTYLVSILHRSWNLDEKPKKLSPKKLDHLVLGEAAGQDLPNRLRCQGLNAINKIKSSSKNTNIGDTVSFVTVFTIYKSNPEIEKISDRVKVGEISYNKADRSMAILNAYINFIQVSMPKSNVIILTDPASKFLLNRENTIISPIQGDYSRNNLMLQRIKSYIAFLERKLDEREMERTKFNENFIFTDSDIAVVDNINEIFKKYPDFHVALTFRNNKNQPLNSGFIAVRGTLEGIKKGKLFLEEILAVYVSKYMGASRMLGDQLALYSVIKSHVSSAIQKFYHRPEIFTEEMKGVSLLFLPCAIYNWTPPEGAGQFRGMPLDVKIVHFKGSRKRLMLESWNYYNSSRDISNMLCLVLTSGRTKYDF